MDFDEDDHQAKAIAEHWGVSAKTLDQASWQLEVLEGNDGDTYGYVVRFAEDTAPEVLEELGIDAEELTREVSLWAFERAEPDDGVYSLDAPFPDILSNNDDEDEDEKHGLPELPLGQIYLTDDRGHFLTGDDGNFLTGDAGNPVSTFSPDQGQKDDLTALKDELFSRLDTLEEAIRHYNRKLPPRGHNNPPSLVEDDPISAAEIAEIVGATKNLRSEARQDYPAPAAISAQASILRRVATSIMSWLGRKVDLGLDSVIKWGLPAGMATWAHAHPERVADALNAAADAAFKLAKFLGGG